jgi:HEAT repeat protein
VRHEAIRLQLTLAAERDLALRKALEDEDPRVVHIGLAALQEGCPPAMARLVKNVATNMKVADDLRLLAVRALGRSVECAECLDGLLQLVDGGRTFLGRRRLAPRTPMLLAALRALADGWSSHPRAAPLLAKASKASDAEIRQAAAPSVP